MNQDTTSQNYSPLSSLVKEYSPAMFDEYGFTYQFENELNKDIEIAENLKYYQRKKVLFNKNNSVLSIIIMPWEKAFGVPERIYNMPERLTNPLYGRDMLDDWINEKARYAPTIERIREITAKLPSLTKILLDDRNNE